MERLLCVLKRWLGIAREPEEFGEVARQPTHEEILTATRRSLELAGVKFNAEGKILSEEHQQE